MSNHWLRLWQDMPTDPKWRTIARISGEHIGLVQAVYMHLLVDASRNVTRGHVTVTPEDLASALDVSEMQIGVILEAMEGRVIESGALSGWDKRQPKREDSGNTSTEAKTPAERKRDQRAREAEKQAVTQGHGESRNVTTDKEERREEKKKEKPSVSGFSSFYEAYPRHEGRKDAEAAFAKLNPSPELLARMLAAIEVKRNTNDWTKEGGKFVPLPATWIRAERWNDEPVTARPVNAFAGAL